MEVTYAATAGDTLEQELCLEINLGIVTWSDIFLGSAQLSCNNVLHFREGSAACKAAE